MRLFSWLIFLCLFIALPAAVSAQQKPNEPAAASDDGNAPDEDELSDPLNPAKAPPRIYLGPVAGYNRSMHSGGFPSISGEASCPQFETGTENGYYFGLTAEYLLGDPKNSNSSVFVRLTYDYMPAFFTVPGDRYPSNINGNVVYSEIEHTTRIKYPLLNFEAMYKFNIPGLKGLGITAGPQIGFVIGGNQEQRFALKFDPTNPVQFSNTDLKNIPQPVAGYQPQFADETRTSIILYSGDIIGKESIRFALVGGVQYEILLGKFYLVPHILYNFGITKINSRGDNWTVSALQIGLDLRRAF